MPCTNLSTSDALLMVCDVQSPRWTDRAPIRWTSEQQTIRDDSRASGSMQANRDAHPSQGQEHGRNSSGKTEVNRHESSFAPQVEEAALARKRQSYAQVLGSIAKRGYWWPGE